MQDLHIIIRFMLLFLVIICDTCDAHKVHRGLSDECNNYIDGIIIDLKNSKEYFEDPYKIANKSLTFSKKFLFINYTGEIMINDGFIYGLPTLHRESDVVVDKSMKRTRLKIFLGAGEIKIACNGKLKLMNHGPNVNIVAKITYISMQFDIVPRQRGGKNPEVVDFIIEEAKGTDIKVSGLGPLGFFLSPFRKIMLTLFKSYISKGIESRIQKFMTDKFKDYVIPMDCLNE